MMGARILGFIMFPPTSANVRHELLNILGNQFCNLFESAIRQSCIDEAHPTPNDKRYAGRSRPCIGREKGRDGAVMGMLEAFDLQMFW